MSDAQLPSKDLCSQLRALPAGYRLLGYTAAEEIERLREDLQRVTYKQQIRAAQELLRRCVAPLKVAIVDAESYDCVLDHDVWARLLDEIGAYVRAAQPPGADQ